MGKHTRTLKAVFADPTRANIKRRDIESLLRHVNAEITEGSGSRVRVALNGRKATFHRPHPRPETSAGAVQSVRNFLRQAGVTP